MKLPPLLEPSKITIRYERAGRCFWHIGCTAQHHAPPMRIGQDDAEKRRTEIHCTACSEAGYYPHGSVGEVCCERIATGVISSDGSQRCLGVLMDDNNLAPRWCDFVSEERAKVLAAAASAVPNHFA